MTPEEAAQLDTLEASLNALSDNLRNQLGPELLNQLQDAINAVRGAC